MTVPSSNVSFSSVQTEFGGSNPISMSEYYSNNTYVPSGLTGVPTSGAISVSNLAGKTKKTLNNSVGYSEYSFYSFYDYTGHMISTQIFYPRWTAFYLTNDAAVGGSQSYFTTIGGGLVGKLNSSQSNGQNSIVTAGTSIYLVFNTPHTGGTVDYLISAPGAVSKTGTVTIPANSYKSPYLISDFVTDTGRSSAFCTLLFNLYASRNTYSSGFSPTTRYGLYRAPDYAGFVYWCTPGNGLYGDTDANIIQNFLQAATAAGIDSRTGQTWSYAQPATTAFIAGGSGWGEFADKP